MTAIKYVSESTVTENKIIFVLTFTKIYGNFVEYVLVLTCNDSARLDGMKSIKNNSSLINSLNATTFDSQLNHNKLSLLKSCKTKAKL